MAGQIPNEKTIDDTIDSTLKTGRTIIMQFCLKPVCSGKKRCASAARKQSKCFMTRKNSNETGLCQNVFKKRCLAKMRSRRSMEKSISTGKRCFYR